MVTFIVILLVIVSIMFTLFGRHYQIRKHHPPGPLGLPLVGQLPLLILRKVFSRYLPKMSPKEYLRQMREKYGDIWSMDMGNYRIIGIASLDTLNEAFIKNGKIFAGRPYHETTKILSEDRGILFVDGELWHNNRQLAIKALRDLGMGKQLLENTICEEADLLIEHIENNSSTPIGSPDIFAKGVSNVMSQLVFSERDEKNNDDLEWFLENIKNITHSNKVHKILGLMSKILPTKYTRKMFPVANKFVKSCSECMEFIGDKCRSRIKIEKEYSKPNCVFDYFWRYRYQDEPEIDPEEKYSNICHTMLDLLIGGTDTTLNILGFCCLMLGQYPDVQEELRTEIRSLVDDYKLINMDTKKDCPKLLSFIDEVHRYCNLAVGIEHRAMETCLLRGYKIQTNDIIYCDLSTIKQDPAIFDHPDDFDAFRFMDKSRTKYVPNKSHIPFGIGKRACLGESIAVMELFIFMSKIIQRFKISFPMKTKNNISKILEGTYGVVHVPLDHEIIFRPLHL